LALCCAGCSPTGDAACAAMDRRNDCAFCCGDKHPTGEDHWRSLSADCLCVSPGPCKIECADTLCIHPPTTDNAACAFCSANSSYPDAGVCDVTSMCTALYSDCAALIACVNSCPDK